MYSIKAISLMTGVKPETLRTWERRFDFLIPTRDENGRRVYSDLDARKLSLISSLLRAGHPIGQLAKMSVEALAELESIPSQTRGSAEQDLLDALMASLIPLDLERFRYLVSRSLSHPSPAEIVDQIFVPVVREIGNRWRAGELMIGEEHALTAVLHEEFTTALRTLRLAAKGPTIVFATPSGEQHHLGLMMGCFLAATEGFTCRYLGADVPSEDLVETVGRLEASVLVVSVVKRDNTEALVAKIREIAAALPESIALWIGTSRDQIDAFGAMPANASFFERYEPFVRQLATIDKGKRR